MTPGAEHLLVLSLRLHRTAANNRMPGEVKGRALQNITLHLAQTLPTLTAAQSPADAARIALANYLRKVAAANTKAEL